MTNPKCFVLKLANNCSCKGCKKTLKKLQEFIGDRRSTCLEAETGELTISGHVDAEEVIRSLKEKGKIAELVKEEIRPKRNNRSVQSITLSSCNMPVSVVQESDDQNLVALVQALDNVKGLKQCEVTYSKKKDEVNVNVKMTFHGKTKDEVNTKRSTQKKIINDDDDYCGSKWPGHCCCGHGTDTSFGGPHWGSAAPWQGNYFPSFGGPHRGSKPASPWQGKYSPPPVSGYEPSAPPLSRYGQPYVFGYPYAFGS